MNGLTPLKKSMLFTGLLTLGLQFSLYSTPSYSVDDDSVGRVGLESMRFKVGVNVPDSDDNWDDGVGIQLQAFMNVDFLPDNYTLGVMLGRMTWDVNSEAINLTGSSASTGVLRGDADITQLGATLMRKEQLNEKLIGSLETSLLWQSFSSDASVVYTYPGGSTQSADLDFDDNFALLLGGDIAYKMDEAFNVLFGATYQFDLGSSDAEALGDTADNESGAFSVNLGLEYLY